MITAWQSRKNEARKFVRLREITVSIPSITALFFDQRNASETHPQQQHGLRTLHLFQTEHRSKARHLSLHVSGQHSDIRRSLQQKLSLTIWWTTMEYSVYQIFFLVQFYGMIKSAAIFMGMDKETVGNLPLLNLAIQFVRVAYEKHQPPRSTLVTPNSCPLFKTSLRISGLSFTGTSLL